MEDQPLRKGVDFNVPVDQGLKKAAGDKMISLAAKAKDVKEAAAAKLKAARELAAAKAKGLAEKFTEKKDTPRVQKISSL